MNDPSFPETTIDRLMKRDLVRVHPTTTVGKALDLMFDQKVSALPVVDDGHCLGIVTATDLVVLIRSITKVLKSEYPHYEDCLWAVDLVLKQAGTDPVRNIMSEVLVEGSPTMTVREAAALMAREEVHHLLVIEDGQLVGFLSSLDVMRSLAD